jgi:hypothetical protein
LVGNLMETDHLKDFEINGKILLKQNFKELGRG